MGRVSARMCGSESANTSRMTTYGQTLSRQVFKPACDGVDEEQAGQDR